MVTLGTKVRILNLIHFKGSRVKLAQATGLAPRTIGAIERGEGKPHFSTIKKLEAAFGRELYTPDTEAAFAILASDDATYEMVARALAYLEAQND